MPFKVIEKAHTPGQGEDIARSAETGGVEGVSSLLGTLGDIPAAGRWAMEKVAKFAGDHGFGDGKIPQSPIPTSGDMMSLLGSAVAKRTGADPRAARLASAIMSPAALTNAPTSKELQGALTGDKPLYQPQTKPGRYARTIAQFAPAAALPGGMVRRAANVVVPAVASETAGEFTEGTPMEPYARVVAALAGSGLVGVAGRAPPTTRMLADASRGATDAQVGHARQLMETAQAEGVRLTMAEALQQVTNSGTGMGRMQRVIEGTRAGNERIAPVMSERPGQVRSAVANFADTIAPATDQPSMIGGQAQQSAEGGLTGVRRFINSVAEANYDALASQQMPPAEYAQLAQNPSYTQALAALRNHPELGAEVAQLPDNNLAVVNEVVKRLNTMGEQVRPGPMNPQGDNGLAALRDQGAGMASELAANASPEWRAARQGVAAGREAYLEPLQRGPLGQIAGTDSVKAQTAALYPTQPLEGAPAETAQALAMLQGQHPQIGASLTRQHLVNALNETTQDLQGGQNQWGGARFAAQVAGNPEQERALSAGVQSVGGDQNRLGSIVEALRATGRRERPGSMTAYNTRDIEELGRAGSLGEGIKAVASGPATFRKVGEALQNFQTERNAGALADAILAEPARAEEILRLARQRVPPGAALDAIERLALSAQQSRPREGAH